MKYCTLICDEVGHVFRMGHGNIPPPGFKVLENCCFAMVLKSPLAWSLPRVRDAFDRSGKMIRNYPVYTKEQIKQFQKVTP